MRMLLMMSMAVTLLSVPAVAQNDTEIVLGDEVDVSFEISRTRLEAIGYYWIDMVNGNASSLSGFDEVGSEVLLSVDPVDGRITRTEYIHFMDR